MGIRDQESSHQAVGIDLYLSGGEDAMRFAWAAVETAPMRVVIAEGWESWEQLDDYRTEKLDAVEIAHFDHPLEIKPPQGINVFGPEYLETLEFIADPVLDEIVEEIRAAVAERGTFLAEDGSPCLPMTQAEHEQLQRKLADQAMKLFDQMLPSDLDAPRALATLAIFGAVPQIDYRQRVLRRLLYLRAIKDQQAFDVALQTACLRLAIGPSELLAEMRKLSDQQALGG